MRIAYVIHSLDGYGAGFPVPRVTGLMRKNGADVRLFALARRNGLLVPALEAAGLPFEAYGGNFTPFSFGWLRRRLEEYKPTVIWTSMSQATLIGGIIGRQMGVPVVSWQHNVYLAPGNQIMLRLAQGTTDIWVADSETVADITRTRFHLPPEKLATWPLFAITPDAPQAKPTLPGAVFHIGSLGRLHPHKGYDILIAAMAELQQRDPALATRYDVTIAGHGPAEANLTALAAKFNVTNIHFAGYTPTPRGFLAEMNGYVQCSRVEGLCISAHEAMQAGLPTIVTSVGEMPRSVKDGETGYVIPPQDVSALAAALGKLVSDPVRAAVMGVAAKAFVNDRFSEARFADAGLRVLAMAQALEKRQ